MRRLLVRFGLVVSLLLLAAPAAEAGGWATVRLDDEPGEVEVGTAWTVGFTVLAHGRTPVNVDVARLLARHRETATEVSALGRQDGAVGHYVAEVTFSRAGEWKWSITTEPYAGTSFETLTVIGEAGDAGAGTSADVAANAGALRLFEGACPAVGRDPVASNEIPLVPDDGAIGLKRRGAKTAAAVWMGIATGDVVLANLLGGDYALAVEREGVGLVACGAVGGPFDGEELTVGLTGGAASDPVGIAVLRQNGVGIEIGVFLIGSLGDPEAADRAVDGRPTAEVEIVGGAFVPSKLEVAPGTTVTWVNGDAIAHTVMGEDLAFEDSGILDLGQAFSQTFDEPGVYRYRCGPHPSMVGTITVG